MANQEKKVSPPKITSVPEKVLEKVVETHRKEDLRKVLLPVDDEGRDKLEVLVKVPSRKILGEFMKFIETNPIKAQELLVNECLLSSVDEVDADDGLFFACVSGITELFPARQAKVKKL